MPAPVIHARLDASLVATVLRSTPLLYADGADPQLDRPAHVRSASGLAWIGGRLAVIQDDANFVALVDPETAAVHAVTLPVGEGGLRQFDDVRGNKRHKLDLESCVAVEDVDGAEMLVAFGSGSTAMRERVVVIRCVSFASPDVRVVDASALYARLRAAIDFSGSELNVEGAAVAGDTLRLFNRGNGASVDGRAPVNAACDVDLAAFLSFLRDPAMVPPPEIHGIEQYDLGDVDGLPLTFTDAVGHGDAILYAAAAEDSPDATRDGPVAGCAIGVLRGSDARYAIVRDEVGARYAGKIEGILPHPRDPARLWAVIDRDDPGAPSELLQVSLAGRWT